MWTLLALEEMSSLSSSNYEWEIILFVSLITGSYYCLIFETFFWYIFFDFSNFLIWKANLVIVILSWLEVGFPSLWLGEEFSLDGKISLSHQWAYVLCYVKIKTLVHGGMQRFFHNEEQSVQYVDVKMCYPGGKIIIY